jgi:predicted ATP-grasp superfamily ATP-dependent carboligase
MSHSSEQTPSANSDTAQPALRVAFGDFDNWEKQIRQNLDARYAPSFVDLARTRLKDFDAVVPLQIRHYASLARHPELRGTKFFHPSPEVTSLCDDKLRLAQFLIAQGFPGHVPKLRSPGGPYPYVWKKRHGWWGMHCHIVKGSQDEQDLDLTDSDWFAQEFVPGEVEFATHLLRVGGQIRYSSTFAHKMATSAFVNGAQDTPLHSTFFQGCHYLELFADILVRLDFEGTACFDYKVADGRPILFEINPRFGGSLCSDVTAYLDAYLGSLTPHLSKATFLAELARFPRRLLSRFR